MVCMGTGFQIVVYLGVGKGNPKSSDCLDVVMTHWIQWAGYPKFITADRGLHNRGIFAKELSAAGVYCGNIGLEAPYQLGKVERHGDIWKKIMGRVVINKNVRGIEMKLAAAEVNATINEMSRRGGFSPAQWVIGRQPRYAAGEIGSDEATGVNTVQERDGDSSTIFARRMQIRHEAKKAFVHLDSSERVAKAMLRKQAPMVQDYQVGDLISFQHDGLAQPG